MFQAYIIQLITCQLHNLDAHREIVTRHHGDRRKGDTGHNWGTTANRRCDCEAAKLQKNKYIMLVNWHWQKKKTVAHFLGRSEIIISWHSFLEEALLRMVQDSVETPRSLRAGEIQHHSDEILPGDLEWLHCWRLWSCGRELKRTASNSINKVQSKSKCDVNVCLPTKVNGLWKSAVLNGGHKTGILKKRTLQNKDNYCQFFCSNRFLEIKRTSKPICISTAQWAFVELESPPQICEIPPDRISFRNQLLEDIWDI